MFVHTQSFEDLTADVELNQEESAEVSEKPQAAAGGDAQEEEQQQVQEEQGMMHPLVKEKNEDVTSEAWRSHKKHVFVLSEAGKPIYTRYGSEEALSTTMGVLMALVSVVEAEKNAIRSIHAGNAGQNWRHWLHSRQTHDIHISWKIFCGSFHLHVFGLFWS